ncbi:MAG: hypothetical protein ACRD3J_10680 [Thermoanaerobaculia bacterium]
MSRFQITLLCLTLLIAGSSIAADTATGTFHLGNVRFEPVDALAYQESGGENGRPVTIVIVTNFKIDKPAAVDAINTYGAIVEQASNTKGSQIAVIRVLAADRCGASAFLNQAQRQIDLANSFVAKNTVMTAIHVTGECFTSKPGTMFDDTYDFHLSYDLPITPIPKPTVLPAGGGEPGAVYAGLVKAIKSADWNAAHDHLADHELPETKPKASEMKHYFEGLALNYPKTVTITGGLMKGDRAALDIKGTNNEGKKIQGSVAMKKTAAGWRVIDQNFFFAE